MTLFLFGLLCIVLGLALLLARAIYPLLCILATLVLLAFVLPFIMVRS